MIKRRAPSVRGATSSLLYAQLSHALSLNDVCDSLRLWATALRALRGATPPARNTLSHANKVRDCGLAEQVFWQVLAHLQRSFPGFQKGARQRQLFLPSDDN